MEEWQSVSETEWSTLLNRWIEPLVPTARVRSARPSTLTVAPYAASGVASMDLRRILVGQIGAKDSEMCLAGSLRGVPVRIDLIGSGLERLAATGRGLVAARTDIDEESIDEEIYDQQEEQYLQPPPQQQHQQQQVRLTPEMLTALLVCNCLLFFQFIHSFTRI